MNIQPRSWVKSYAEIVTGVLFALTSRWSSNNKYLKNTITTWSTHLGATFRLQYGLGMLMSALLFTFRKYIWYVVLYDCAFIAVFLLRCLSTSSRTGFFRLAYEKILFKFNKALYILRVKGFLNVFAVKNIAVHFARKVLLIYIPWLLLVPWHIVWTTYQAHISISWMCSMAIFRHATLKANDSGFRKVNLFSPSSTTRHGNHPPSPGTSFHDPYGSYRGANEAAVCSRRAWTLGLLPLPP